MQGEHEGRTSLEAVLVARQNAQRAAHKLAEEAVQLRLEMIFPVLHTIIRAVYVRTYISKGPLT